METLESNKAIRKETDTPVRCRASETQSAGREEAKTVQGGVLGSVRQLERAMKMVRLGPSQDPNGLERDGLDISNPRLAQSKSTTTVGLIFFPPAQNLTRIKNHKSSNKTT